MAGLRQFTQDDTSEVADLVWRVLHGHEGPAPSSLKIYLEDLFLHNPWLEDGLHSWIYEDATEKIVGFFGAVPRRMCWQGRTVRMAFGSNFVVSPDSRASMVAIQLVKAFLRGPQDVSITDSANEMSRKLLRSLGFSIVPIYSLQWARPLRPSQYAFQAAARLKKSRLIASIQTITKPICWLIDGLATKLSVSPFRQPTPVTSGDELDAETLLSCLGSVPSKAWLLPAYDRDSLNWVLEFVASRKVFGNLRKVAVRDQGGKILGWYIYHVAPGSVGEVVQIGSEPPSVSKVLDHLFHDALQHGLIGLHGRLEPQFMQELTLKSCFFFRNGSWTLAHSAKPELLGLLQSGNAFFSRLDGEWCLRHGGEQH